jgi:hypothetical protein
MPVIRIGDVNAGELVGCDGCGTVAVLALSRGWRSYDTGIHCPQCVERNDLIRGGLVHGVDPATAVTYTGGASEPVHPV